MSDKDYFLRRVGEELAAAEQAATPQARRAHSELANRYLTMINYQAATSAGRRETPSERRLSA